jgi:hypothetical protein
MCRIDITVVTECSARILRRQSTLLLSRLACAESTEYATSHAIIRCAYPCRYRLREMQETTSTFPSQQTAPHCLRH